MKTHADRPDNGTVADETRELDLETRYRDRHARLEGAGRFVRLVAEGGMGAVLEVECENTAGNLERRALKMVKQRLLPNDELVERFRRELKSHHRLSARFQVPRLVPCLAFSDHEDPRYVFGLFPFYPEGSLDALLRQGIATSEALWILADAVEGLQSLHGLDYVHRDIHPANILVEREGGRRRGVLGDLGVGMFLASNTIFAEDEVDADRKRTVGHRGFIDLSAQASVAADLYAVGATLYRILAGRSPLVTETLPLSLPEDPALEDLSAGLSGPMRRAADRLLAGLTAPELTERFSSAPRVRDELVDLAEQLDHEEQYSKTRSSRAHSPAASTATPPTVALAAPAAVETGRGGRTPRRITRDRSGGHAMQHTVRNILLAAAVLLAIGGAAFTTWWWSSAEVELGWEPEWPENVRVSEKAIEQVETKPGQKATEGDLARAGERARWKAYYYAQLRVAEILGNTKINATTTIQDLELVDQELKTVYEGTVQAAVVVESESTIEYLEDAARAKVVVEIPPEPLERLKEVLAAAVRAGRISIRRRPPSESPPPGPQADSRPSAAEGATVPSALSSKGVGPLPHDYSGAILVLDRGTRLRTGKAIYDSAGQELGSSSRLPANPEGSVQLAAAGDELAVERVAGPTPREFHGTVSKGNVFLLQALAAEEAKQFRDWLENGRVVPVQGGAQ